MPTSTLFPLDRETLKPAKNRREPDLMLRRVVILSILDSKAVIRNIPFRRGLNIIKTKQMKAQGGPVAGHSVGKTLLMRMIRYTLGEPYFGTEETQHNLASTPGLEAAHVVAHWTVAGNDWAVVRPLRMDESSESYCVQCNQWQQAIDAPEQKLPHRYFVETVNAAVLTDLPTFTLPRGRDAKWLDVLAWLSRDYQCGYRKANEWRHEDAHSGPTLDRDENSLIMQWLMGMMSADEVALRLKHTDLLKQRAEQKRTVDREQKKLETLWESLRERLELTEDAEIEDDQPSLASITPAKVVTDKVASLRRLRKERIDQSKVSELESAHTAALQQVTDAEGAIGECRGTITLLKRQIAEYEADPTKPYARCQADPCWMSERAKKAARDPAKDEHLADFRTQLDTADQQLKEAQREKRMLVKVAENANQQLETEKKRLADELTGIDQSIGQWQGMEKEASSFQSLASSANRITKKLKKADRDYDESLKTLDDLRKKDRRKLNRLSEVYEQILQKIFGAKASGKLQVDGNGLTPVPDKRLAPSGAALSVMTTVLAFDVSCLAASVYGHGQHPRFLTHDSPREGDMEGPLFRRLFEIVHELESQFTDTESVSFQYIVTTTSEPPKDLANPQGPYVVETLDATGQDGRLMRRVF
ncbi:Chromosome partition protein Smc [Stieleria maiorica]|uniref:Chromosome partition protein Smc n=1 Tax=Stieleria maiorica TaxID=2795974 RepID=A0A5B9MG66_9BACT|nr:hypothetical protein [Stieleria maiorica]QEG00159.1 Chromosome partition protein Smc [Stieleria maiorica]